MQPMNKIRPIIVALLVGWVSGAGSWYFITNDQADDQRHGDAPHVVLPQAAGEETVASIFPPAVAPVESGNAFGGPPSDSVTASPQSELPALLPMDEAWPDAGVYAADDGLVQDTGEFIDADDPQAYVVYLNAQANSAVTQGDIQDTGEFIDVDNPQMYVDGNAAHQDTGVPVDADDPQAYVSYMDAQADGVVQDTGEFIEMEPLH